MLLRALLKRPARASTGQAGATWRLDRIDADHLRRYNAAFGFKGDTVPLTFLYLLAQRAQLATMLACPIPFRIPGLIHVENRLAMHGPVVPDAPLALTTALQLPPPAPNGALHAVLETRAFDGERLAFSCDSTYLIRRGSRSGRDTPPPEPPRGQELGGWTVALDAGRRYAALSGDWNPIHLWRWSARLMGMRAPIIHGAHTLAKACALQQASTGQDIAAVWCRFRQPVALGAHVTLQAGGSDGEFTVMCGERIAMEGRYS
ncbi:MaoC family dehydratase [Massilia sp. CFBP9026]|uniref:MaoC family dehydratase n=1 Tax=Massilia sp. CFBP9026 TaxID=3096536 RepID=UPI002A6A5E9F|nr:MaoC/PaaZ C-terminal domain-containing protein [Massilia sp. CFBP9026]MDY0963567.1 MaoC/PaaZ C-terminal domain-containing protein [Massilia sp. CFBP9026]